MRLARVFILTCIIMLDSAQLALGSPVGLELEKGRLVVVGEPTIKRYPQAVDNSRKAISDHHLG